MKKKLEITIPTTLMDITVSQYQRFLKETEHITNESIVEQKIVTILCGITLQQLRELNSNQVEDIMNKMSPLVESFSSSPEFVHRFWLNGVEYGFIPNLEEDISYGENKDITKAMSEGVEGIHKAMAILYRPIKKFLGFNSPFKSTYKIDEYKVPVKHEDALKEMPVAIALGAQVFFWALIKELLMHIPKYLEKEMGEEKYNLMMKKASTSLTGEDMMKSSASLKEILQDLTK